MTRAVAFQYPEAPHTARGKPSPVSRLVSKTMSERISSARAILRHSRELARDPRGGARAGARG
jgi:hypothetical protein